MVIIEILVAFLYLVSDTNLSSTLVSIIEESFYKAVNSFPCYSGYNIYW